MRRRVSRAQAGEAAAGIAQRRTDEDDPTLASMPDDLLSLVNYVIGNPAVAADVDDHHRHRAPHTIDTVQRELRQADAADVLTILDYVTEWADRYRLAAMNLGRDNGWSWPDLARAGGMKDRRYAEATYTRLYGAVTAGTGKHEKNARIARRTPAPPPRQRPPTVRRTEVTELDHELHRAIRSLVELEDLMPAAVDEDIVATLQFRTKHWHGNRPIGLETASDLSLVLNSLRNDSGHLDVRLQAAAEVAESVLLVFRANGSG